MPRAVHGVALLVASLCAGTGFAQAPFATSPLTAVLGQLADRTQQYYDRFTSIICTETVLQQELKSNLQPSGKPRVNVYELSVVRDAESQDASGFRVERTLLSVNGRTARKNQEPGCTDPKTGTPEPLGFLLAENQSRFRFTLNEQAVGGPTRTRALDFKQFPPSPAQVKWADNCFTAEGGGMEGRVWFDPVTFDVMQIDARLSKPFAVRMPDALFRAQSRIRVARSDTTIRFERVRFEIPDEIVLLPESMETLTVFEGVPSLRTEQKLTNFRRFLAETTIRAITF
jgi:hypothetical protein